MLCPGAITSCPAGITIRPGVVTLCPGPVTLCPGVETIRPGVDTNWSATGAPFCCVCPEPFCAHKHGAAIVAVNQPTHIQSTHLRMAMPSCGSDAANSYSGSRNAGDSLGSLTTSTSSDSIATRKVAPSPEIASPSRRSRQSCPVEEPADSARNPRCTLLFRVE